MFILIFILQFNNYSGTFKLLQKHLSRTNEEKKFKLSINLHKYAFVLHQY